MDVLRTPDERFEGLPDYRFTPHYREVESADGTRLRFHFLDEGPRDAAPVLLLHGNPAWCYLYRHMIPGLVGRGHRVVALDLMGLGRSDKPVDQDAFTMSDHTAWMGRWLEAEDLARRHPVLPGLGRHPRPRPPARVRAPVRPGRRLQHGPAGGQGHEQVHGELAGVQPVGRRAPRRVTRPERDHPGAVGGRGGRLRRPLSGRHLPGRPQALPAPDPGTARQPRGAPGQGDVGLPRDVGEAVPHRLRRSGRGGVQGRSPRGAAAADPRGPGPAPPRHRGGGPLHPGGRTRRAGGRHRRVRPA